VKVKILVEFDVPEAEDENVAKSAASMAAYHFLAFCTVVDFNPGRDECKVHVDGHGEYLVRVGEDHE